MKSSILMSQIKKFEAWSPDLFKFFVCETFNYLPITDSKLLMENAEA